MDGATKENEGLWTWFFATFLVYFCLKDSSSESREDFCRREWGESFLHLKAKSLKLSIQINKRKQLIPSFKY